MKQINQILLILGVLILASCNKDNDPIITEATSAQFYKSSFSLAIGGREKIMLTMEPEGAVLLNAKWSSSDTTIIKVDSIGIVTAIATGEATISLAASNNISGECTVKVIESPITGLVMPEARFPIAKDAIVFLQGTGFTSNSKIILRHHTDFKSTNGDEDILAQIQEQTMNYLSFAVTVSPGLYNIVLDENGKEFDLGNIEVEIPNLPEYQFDKNKIVWDDTHWRRFQLRGKVKEIVIESIYQRWTSSATYYFNNKGYLETFSRNNGNSTTSYEYDKSNRLIRKNVNCSYGNINGKIVNITCEYSYGDHSLYIPIDLDSYTYTEFQPSSYAYLPCGGSDDGMYNLEMYQKGIKGIKNVVHYSSGITDVANYEFQIAGDKATTSGSHVYFDGSVTTDYVWYFKSGMPFSEIFNTTYKYEEIESKQIDKKEYIFSNNNMPINSESIHSDHGNTFSPTLTTYIQDCPFVLYSSYTYEGDYKRIIEYDANWNIVKYLSEYSVTNFYYLSYDEKGNWTECFGVEKYHNSGDGINIFKLTRDITYW